MKIRKVIILAFMIFPMYVGFNNLLGYVESLFCFNSFRVTFIGTACTLEFPASPKLKIGTCQYAFLVVRIFVLLSPLFLKRVLPERYFLLFLYTAIAILFLDFLGIIIYTLSEHPVLHDLFRLHLSNIELYQVSRKWALPRIVVPSLALVILVTSYYVILVKNKWISTDKVMMLFVGATSSLCLYFMCYKLAQLLLV